MDDSQKSLTSRFDFLDGYRGLCALIVTIHHMCAVYPPGDFEVFLSAGFFIGVFGFFVLSSFLLTYRMAKDFEKSQSKIELLEIILKYVIRRFFRIYIPFMIFVTCVKLGPPQVKGIYGDTYNTWLNFLLLDKSYNNHLWTVPIEIKFYFLIPIICLIFYYSKKYYPIVIIFSICLLLFLYNTYLYYPPEDAYIQTANKLYVRFPIFFSGSVVAYVYLKYENSTWRGKEIMKRRDIRFFFSLLSYWMAAYGVRHFSPYYNISIDSYKDSIHPGIKFSIFLFIMLISSPNGFTRLLSDNYFLKKIGKYSFGVYLWHPMCITLALSYSFSKRLDTYATAVGLSQICGILFYFIIENPMMKIGNNLIKRVELIFEKYKFTTIKQVISA